MIPRMLAENSGTKSAATVLTELSAAHKEDNGKCIGYNIDAEQSLSTDIVSTYL
jgi:chaperonin GroEL (HSP60 family)